MADNGYSATDIITYIGVPLAVLGVLPILYNTFVTLVNASKIKRTLRHSRLTALTRSDVVNRVIEIELPRYAVAPWDRFQHRRQYWSLSRHPSSIPGGSWTTFNWRTRSVGVKTQRVEYADQLRQPQVDVAFDDLVCYLLDLGAVPDPHGWRLLRSTGLWTPVGCALMKSPSGHESALTIAPLDDSDGNLSLAVSWSERWTTRDYSHLPPYWVRLAPPPPPPPSATARDGNQGDDDDAGESSSQSPVTTKEEDSEAGGGEKGESIRKDSLDSASQQPRGEAAAAALEKPITCQISGEGVEAALAQEEQLQSQSTLRLDSLYIEHIRGRAPAGRWFASAATALGTTSQTVLWNYRIPDAVLGLARRETVPCGVLVLLGVATDADTPEWASRPGRDDAAAALDVFARRNRDQRAAIDAEMRMPAAQREAAVRERMRRENEQRMQDMRDKMRLDTQRRENCVMEALQSPKWDNKLVADRNLAWLESKGHVAPGTPLREAVGHVLHRMVRDGRFAAALAGVLDGWKAWADIGGMKRADFQALQDDQVLFAQATLLVALIKDASMALEGTLSMDLQECLRMWKKVRLG